MGGPVALSEADACLFSACDNIDPPPRPEDFPCISKPLNYKSLDLRLKAYHVSMPKFYRHLSLE